MDIDSFVKKHCGTSRPIKETIHNWMLDKKVSEFLNTKILDSVLIVDVMVGDGFSDSISNEVKEAFKELMGEKGGNYYEIKKIILEKWRNSESSLEGLINKIQGTLGENEFVRQTGRAARLASSGSQRGWDVVINRGDHNQYVQVKVYEDADHAIKMLKELKEDIDAGLITDGDTVVHSVDFAVNSDIYEEVSDKAADLGISSKILNIVADRDEIREYMYTASDNVMNPLEHFFHELLGDICTGIALNIAINGFLMWMKAKDRAAAIEDVAYGSALYAGGISAASLTEFIAESVLAEAFLLLEIETAAAILSGPVGGIIALGVGMSVRGVLKRISNRRFIVKRLTEGNEGLKSLCEVFT